MSKKRLAQKNEWLQKAGNSSLLEFLGDKVAELNKEGQEMEILQKDSETEAETVVTNTEVENTSQEKSAETSVQNPELTKEEIKPTGVLTKEEVASTFVELLTPVLEVQKELKEANAVLLAKIETLEKALKEKVETISEETPVASLTSLVKERLFAQLNGKVNGFSDSSIVKETDELAKSKPAIKVEKEEQPKHALQGLLEGF